jgi:DNA-binding MarR family transcriptional regulator
MPYSCGRSGQGLEGREWQVPREAKAADPLTAPEHAGHGAGRAITRLNRQVEVAIAPTGMKLSQYRLLCLIADGMSGSSDVAARLAVRPTSVTEIVEGMVARGWVLRGSDPSDRRRSPLTLSRSGARVLEKAQLAVTERLRAIAKHLDVPAGVTDPLLVLEAWHEALDHYASSDSAKPTPRSA